MTNAAMLAPWPLITTLMYVYDMVLEGITFVVLMQHGL